VPLIVGAAPDVGEAGAPAAAVDPPAAAVEPPAAVVEPPAIEVELLGTPVAIGWPGLQPLEATPSSATRCNRPARKSNLHPMFIAIRALSFPSLRAQ